MISNINTCRLFTTIQENYKLDDKKTISLIKLTGTFININGMDYILSCYHGLDPSNDDIICIYYDIKKKEYVQKKCKLIILCEEYDIALLQIYKLKKSSLITIDKFTQSFIINNPKYKINIYENNTNIDNTNINNIKEWLTKELTYINIIFDKYTGFLCSQVPYIVMDAENLKGIKLDGFSGSLIYNDHHILGMLVREDIITKKLKILHSSAIYRFLNEFSITNKFDGLINIVGDFSECQFELNKNNICGLRIGNTYDINYNNVKNPTKIKKSNLRNGDIIYMVNNYNIIDGCIIDPIYNIPINFFTYISLKYRSNDSIKLNLLRLKPKLEDDYDEKQLNINARPMKTMKYIQISNFFDYEHMNNQKNKKYYFEFAGFIFAELTESIINEYRKKNIILRNVIDKYMNQYKYRDKDISIIVIIHADSNIFDTASDYKDFFPLKYNSGNEHDIGILTKVNKKQITRLSDIKEYIDKQSLTKMNFEFNSEFKIHMIFERLTLIKIYFSGLKNKF